MSTTTLVLSFLDEEGNESNLVIKNPKEDLYKEDVQAVMQTVITNGAFLSSKELALDSINDCYYKTVSTSDLETKTPEE